MEKIKIVETAEGCRGDAVDEKPPVEPLSVRVTRLGDQPSLSEETQEQVRRSVEEHLAGHSKPGE